MTDNADTTTDKRSSTRKEIAPSIVSNELKKFYENHGIDVDCLAEVSDEDPSASRFIRLNPRFDRNETLLLLKNELASINYGHGSSTSAEPLPVPWLNDESLGFYALPGNFRLAQSPCYNQGRIYGMDISSGAAVAALLSNKYDKINNDQSLSLTLPAAATRNQQDDSMEPFRVLDLCCAPGLKLCAIADWLSGNNSNNILPGRKQQESPSMLDKTSVVVGIDISENRIATCKRILHKYHVHPETSGKGQKDTDNKVASNNQQLQSKDVTKNKVRIRLYCCDGTTFDRPLSPPTNQPGLPKLVFDSMAAMEEEAVTGKRKRMNKSARARERKRLKTLAGEDFVVIDTQDEHEHEPLSRKDAQDNGNKNESENSTDNNKSSTNNNWNAKHFDRVLVDAECSTDGSLKHIQKQIMNNNKTFHYNNDNVSLKEVANKLTDEAQLAALVQLQKKLVAAGFRVLKPGGVMVYSTCSLSHDQNEHVVEWLLKEFAEKAFVIPVGFPTHNNEGLITEGEFGVRFHPCFPATKTMKANESTGKGHTSSHRHVFFGGGFFISKIGKRF